MEIKRAIELGDGIREKLSELYVEAFFDDGLKYFSNDKTILEKVFAHVFLLEYFYVALVDNEVAGMLACMGKGTFCMKFNKKIFIKKLGLFKGLFTCFAFKNYPKKCAKLDKDTALLEFFAVSKNHQKMGIGSTLMKYLLTLPQYKHFVGEVADTNPRAFELYKKLGFKELYRKKFIPNSGINNWIQIKYSKD